MHYSDYETRREARLYNGNDNSTFPDYITQ